MTSIKYSSFKIDTIQASSGLFMGINRQKGRFSSSQINEGFGKISGKENKVTNNAGIVEKKL